jgi:hypothetical protein
LKRPFKAALTKDRVSRNVWLAAEGIEAAANPTPRIETDPFQSDPIETPFKQRRARVYPKTPVGPLVLATAMSMFFYAKGLILAAGTRAGARRTQRDRSRGGTIDAWMIAREGEQTLGQIALLRQSIHAVRAEDAKQREQGANQQEPIERRASSVFRRG